MRFIRTVMLALLIVLLTLFAYRNWVYVPLNLWGDIQADIKLPLLLLVFFLIGFLPTWALMWARLRGCRRRIEALERTRASIGTAETPPADEQEIA